MGSLLIPDNRPAPICGQQPESAACIYTPSIHRESVCIAGRWCELWCAEAELNVGGGLTHPEQVFSASGDPTDPDAWSDEPSDWDDACHACATPGCDRLVLEGFEFCRECEAWESEVQRAAA